MARVRDDVREQRQKLFVTELARTGDPVEAARRSKHPAERALETMRDLGFKLEVLDPSFDEAA